jgi:hypothetical protein
MQYNKKLNFINFIFWKKYKAHMNPILTWKYQFLS